MSQSDIQFLLILLPLAIAWGLILGLRELFLIAALASRGIEVRVAIKSKETTHFRVSRYYFYYDIKHDDKLYVGKSQVSHKKYKDLNVGDVILIAYFPNNPKISRLSGFEADYVVFFELAIPLILLTIAWLIVLTR